MSYDKSFTEIGIRIELQKACIQLHWEKPTGIQALAIPHALEGRNLVALAETGSGKTAAYALPILQVLLDAPYSYFALVLVPTRELAAQVQAQFNALGKAIGLSTVLLVGGVPITQQADQMRIAPPHILIATPGRLVDHLKKTKGFDEMKLASLRFLVVDEADRLLGSDFDSVLEKILCVLPTKRQTFLFSATMTSKVGKLQRASVRDPAFVSTRKSKFQAVSSLRQYVHLVPQVQLDSYLVQLLRVAFCPEMEFPGLEALRLDSALPIEDDGARIVIPTSVIVFTRTRSDSNRLSLILRQFLTQPIIALNGDMPQAQRLGSLYKFKQSRGSVLVATDVASRGLDIPQVGLVVNYDVPLDAKTYIHRVGRTARAGRAGCALTLLTQYSVVFFMKEIESHLLSSKGNQHQKIPALVEPNSLVDKALDAAVIKLDAQIREARARSNQALATIQKRSKSSRSRRNISTWDIVTSSLDSLPTKPGMKRTGWASDASNYRRNEILEVMQVVSVEPTAPANNDDNVDIALQTNYDKRRHSKKRRKVMHKPYDGGTVTCSNPGISKKKKRGTKLKH